MADTFMLFMIFIGVVFSVFIIFHYSRTNSILEYWAESNGYEIMSREHRFFRLGPFWWRKSKSHEVYYVTIRTLDGEIRRGWVRCGSWFWGIFTNKADVEWDE
jgi:hypothetical protein